MSERTPKVIAEVLARELVFEVDNLSAQMQLDGTRNLADRNIGLGNAAARIVGADLWYVRSQLVAVYRAEAIRMGAALGYYSHELIEDGISLLEELGAAPRPEDVVAAMLYPQSNAYAITVEQLARLFESDCTKTI